MQRKIDAFKKLAKIFKDNGFNLYLVGGTVRDLLLNKPLIDLDITGDATPNEIKSFLSCEMNDRFASFGALTIHFDEEKFDYTTLRKEKHYKDSRHPSTVEFVKSPKLDYKRRDFTINALYIGEDFSLYDFAKGQKDLNNKVIRMIGNPLKRIKEDPLRILRAIRFSLMLRFEIDLKLKKAIHKSVKFLEKLNKDKIKQELLKIKNVEENEKLSLFNEFNILYLLDMVK